MNKIFKVIWNHATQTWQAVSELAKGHIKSSSGGREGIELPNFALSKLTVALALSFGAVGASYAGYVWNKSDTAGSAPLNPSTTNNGGLIYIQEHAQNVQSVVIGSRVNRTNITDGHLTNPNGIADGNMHQLVAIGNDINSYGRGSVAIGGDDISTPADQARNFGNIAGLDYTSRSSFQALTVNGAGAVAVGSLGKAIGAAATAVGTGAQADGAGNTAIGAFSRASGQGSTAFGIAADATANRAAAFGMNATASAQNSLALGFHSKVTSENSVAIGSHSEVLGGPIIHPYAVINGVKFDNFANNGNVVGVVSVGNATASRQVTNVAAGRITQTSTDAINGSQLYSVLEKANPKTYFHINTGRAGNNATAQAHDEINANIRPSNFAPAGEAGGAMHMNSIAIGNNVVSGVTDITQPYENKNTGAVAIGYNTSALGRKTVAIGTNSHSYSVTLDSVVVGADNAVYGQGSGIFGIDNKIEDPIQAIALLKADAIANSYIVGSSNNVNTSATFVLGGQVNAFRDKTKETGTIANSVYLGFQSSAKGGTVEGVKNRNTDGNDASTTTAALATLGDERIDGVKFSDFAGKKPIGLVTIGAGDSERRLQNVAAGELSATSTDGVNGSQLYSAMRITANLANSAASQLNGRVNENGTITANLNVANQAHTTVHSAITALDNRAFQTQANGVDAQTLDKTRTKANFKQGKNIIVSGAADGITIATANELNADAFVSGGIRISNAAGIQAGNKIISYVADGANDDHAVNVRQLKANITNLQNTIQNTVAGASPDVHFHINTGVNNGTGNKDFNSGKITEAGGALSNGSIAIGFGAQAGSPHLPNPPIVGGSRPVVSSVAIGENTIANATESVAIGLSSIQGGEKAKQNVAIGAHNRLNNAAFSVAIGASNNLQAKTAGQVLNGTIVVGEQNSITSNQTYVLGSYINLGNTGETVHNSIYLGYGSSATGGSTTGVNNLNAFGNLGKGATTTAALGQVQDTKINGVTFGGFSGRGAAGLLTIGSAGNERRIQNVSAGELSATSTDAVNGSQLYSAMSVTANLAKSAATQLGGNVNADGSITANINVGGNTYNTINKAFEALDNRAFQTQANGVDAQTLDKTRTKANFKQGKNIVVSGAADGITIATANELNAEAFVSGGIRLSEAGGLNMANKVISNLGAGQFDDQAVNLGQLKANITSLRQDITNAGGLPSFKTQANGVAAQTIDKANPNANFINGENIVVSGDASGIKIATSRNLNVDSVTATNKVAVGGNLLSTTGLTVGGVSITNAGGINAGGKNISGVATATQDDQAVNFGQLKGLQATLLSGDSSASVVTHNGLEVSSTPKGNITEYKVGLDANTRANLTAGGSALQNIITQANGVNAQTLDKTNNKANFTQGKNIVVTGSNSGINIATKDDMEVTSIKAGTNVFNGTGLTVGGATVTTGGFNIGSIGISSNGIALGGKQITGLGAGTAADHAVNLGQLTANITSLRQDITNGAGIQSFKTQANGVAAQTIDKANPNANFINGENIVVSGDASGIKIATSRNLNVDSVTATNKVAVGGNSLSTTGLTVGGVSITNAGGINAGGKNISGVATATQDDQAVNYGQLKGLQAAVLAGDTSASVATQDGIALIGTQVKGTVTEYKIGLDANTRANITAGGNALQNIVTQANGVDAQTLDKTNNKANFKAGSNIKITGARDGITIATADDLVATSFKAGNVNLNANGLTLGGKAITGLAAGTAADHAVNLGQLTANITNLNQAINANKVTVEKGNDNVTVSAQTTATGTVYKVSAKDTTATVSAAAGGALTVNPGAEINGVKNFEVDLSANTKTAITAAGTALQGFHTQANGVDAQKVDKNNPKANFTQGDNIEVTGTASGIKIATSRNLNVDTLKATGEIGAGSFKAGTNVFNNAGLTVGGISLTNGGLDMGNKAISNVADATQAHQAVNLGQLNNLKATLLAGDTTASVVTHNGLEVSQTVKGTVTEYKVGLDAESRNKLASADSALQGIVTQADGVDAQTLDKTNNKANFKAGANIKLTAARDGITIATKDDLVGNSFTAGGVSIGKNGITLGGKQIGGVGDATAADQAVNLGQLTANLTTINNTLKDNKVKVEQGNANVTVTEENNPTGGKIYKVSAKDTSAKVTQGSGVTVQTVGTTDGVTEFKVGLDAATTASLGKADNAIQSFKTRVNGADAQTVDKNNPNADFTAGDNIVLTGTASGIKIATSRNLEVDTIKSGSFNVGGNTFNAGGLTVGGINLTAGGLDMGNKAINNVATATENHQAVNYGQLKDLQATLTAGDTTASVSAQDGITVVDVKKTGTVTDYKVGLTAEVRNNLTAASSALQGIVTQADGVDAQTLDKTNNKANFKAGTNIKLTAARDGITIATSDELVANSFKAGNVIVNANGINLGGKKISGLEAGTNPDDAVNLEQLTTNITTINNKLNNTINNTIKDNQVKVETGNANVTVAEEVNPTGGKIYKVSAKDTSAKVTEGSGVTVQTVGTTDGVTEFKVGLDAATTTSLGKADSALQSFKTRVNGADAQTIDKNNPNADFTAGDNIVLTGSASGIKIATSRNLDVDKITAGTNVFNSTGLTIGGVSITNAGGINAGDKEITNVKSGGNVDTNAANIADVKRLAQAATSAGDTTASVSVDNGIELIKVDTVGNKTDYKVGLTAEVRNNLTSANTAVQTLATQVDGTDAQQLDKTNNKANFKTGKNIVLTGAADGIKVSTADEVSFTKVSTGGVQLSGNGLVMDGKNISGLADAQADDQAVNLRQLTANITNLSNTFNNTVTNSKWSLASSGNTVANEINPNDKVIFEGVGLLNVTHVAENGKDSVVKFALETQKIKATNGVVAADGNSKIGDTATGGVNTGALVTAGDVIDVVNNSAWTLKTSATPEGAQVGTSLNEQIKAGKQVELIAGKNLSVQQAADGKVTFATKDEVTFNKLTVGGVSISNTGGIDMGNKQIGNLGSGLTNAGGAPTDLAGAVGTNAVNVDDLRTTVNKLNSSLTDSNWKLVTSGNAVANEVNPTDTVKFTGSDVLKVTHLTENSGVSEVKFSLETAKLTTQNGKTSVDGGTGNENKLVTAGDVTKALNSASFGIFQHNETTAKGEVSAGDKVRFVNSTYATANVSAENADGTNITFDINAGKLLADNSALVYTKENGEKVFKQPDGSFKDASGAVVPQTQVIVSVQNPDGSTTKETRLTNLKSTLDVTTPTAGAGVKEKAAPTVDDANLKNAATVGDVLNAGWNLKENNQARDLVRAYDTVNFVNGVGTTANVSVNADGTIANVTFNSALGYVNGTNAADKSTPTNIVSLQGAAPGAAVQMQNLASGLTKADGSVATNLADAVRTNAVNAGDLSDTVTKLTNNLAGSKWNLSSSGNATQNNEINPDDKVVFEGVGSLNVTHVAEAGKDSVVKFALETQKLKSTNGVVGTDGNSVIGGKDSGKVNNDALVTAGDVINVMNNTGFTLKTAATAEGSQDGASLDELITAGKKVELTAGKNIKVKQEADGKVTFATEDEVEFTKVKIGNIDIRSTGDTITFNNGGTGPTTITNIKANLDDTGTGGGATVDFKGPPTLKPTDLTNVATVADVLNAGWNLKENDKNRDFVRAYDTVNFVNGVGTTANVTVTADGKLANVTFNSALGYVNATNAADKSTPTNIVSLQGSAAGTPVQMQNLASGLTKADGSVATNLADAVGTNAVNVQDLRSSIANNLAASKWNLASSGNAAANEINPDDKVVFEGVGSLNVTHVAEAGKDSVVKFALETQKLKSTNGVVGTDGNSVIGGKDSGKVNNDALVTAGDVINVMNNTGFTLKTAATAEGTQDGASLDELITAGKKVELTAGKNIKVKQEADGKVTFATEDEVEFTKVKIGDISIDSAGNKITFGTTTGGPTTITNIKANLDDTSGTGGKPVDFKGPGSLTPADLSNVATVGDVLNAGWNLKENDQNRDFVRAYDTVNFVNGVGTTANVSVNADGTVANVTFNSALAYVNTGAAAADKSTPSNVVALQGPAAGGAVRMENLASGLVKADGSAADVDSAVDTNAVNVKDLRETLNSKLTSSKWNLSSSGNSGVVNDINPDDKVVFEGVGSLNVTHVAEAGKDSVVKFALETQKLTTTNGVVGTDGNSLIGGKDSGKVNNDALVTAGDVINVMNNTGFTLKTAATADGSQDGTSLDELITAGKKVELTAGKNIKVKQEADGKVTFATEDEVEFTKVKIGDISIDSAGNKITFGTTTGGPTTITNIKANLDDTSGTGGKPVDFKGPGSLTPADLSNVATVGDVLNAGWNLKENDQNRDFVRAYDTVNFVNGVGTTANVSVNADGTVANITFNSPLGYVNTGAPTDKSTWTNIVRFEGGAANEAVQVQNVASGVRDSVKAAAAGNPTVKEIADAIAAADATTWNNAVNVRDLQAVANAGKTAIASPKKTIDIGAPVIDPATGATTYNIEVANTALTIADGAGTLPKGKVEAPNADPATGDAHKFVNAGDLANAINNAGFTVYENNGATEKAFVSAGDQVSFNNSTYAIAKVDAESATGRTNITFDIDTAKMFAEQSSVVYTKEDGEVVYKQPDGTFKDKTGATVPADQIVVSVKSPDGTTTTPSRLTNLKSTLDSTATPTGGAPVTEKTAPTLTGSQQSNAATVGDVLNAGWNLQQNGAAKDFVRAYDTVNFVNGIGTRADVSVNADGSVANITFNSALGYVNTNVGDMSNVSNTVKLIGVETGGNMEAVQLTNLASGVRGAVTPANPNKLTPAEIDAIVAAIANATDGTLTNAVNVGDLKAVVESAANKLQQSGWNVGVAAQETANTALTTAGKALVADGATEKVNPNDNVRFADGKNSIVSVATLDQITNDGSKETNTFVRVDVDMPMDYRYTDNTGAEVAKGPDGYFYYVDKATGLPDTKSPRVDATTVSKVGAKLTQGNDAAASYTAATIPALDPAKPTEKDTVHAGTNGVNLGNVAWATEKDQAVNKDQLEQTVNTAGFNVTANGVGSHNTPAKDIEKVTANDAVNFINGTNTQVTAETTRDASGKDTTNIRVDVVGMPMTYTTATGDKVAKAPDGNYYKVGANGLPDTSTPAVSPADIIASMVNPDGDSTTKPTTLANVADGAKVIHHATPANKLEEAENGLADLAGSNGNNAVNVNDLKNLGWVISTSDETGNTYADDVRHNGKVNFTGDGQFINVKGETKADGTREIKVELKTGEIVKSNEGVGKVGGADVDIIKVGADWYLKGDVDPTTGAPYAGKTPVTLDPNTVVVNKGNGLVTGNQVADAIAQTGFTVGKFDDSKLSQAQKDKLATAFTDPAQNGDEKINPDDQLRYMDTGTTTVGLGTVVDNNPDGSKQTTTIVKVDVNTYGLSVEDGNIAPDARGKVNAPEMTATVGGVDVSVVKVGNDYYAKADINPLTGLPNAGATKVTLDPGTGVKGDGAKLVDAASLASTLNNVGFNVNVGAEGSGVVTSSVPSGELIRAGNSVTFQAGNNLNVKHEANGKVTFATNENVSFTNVHAGNSVVIGDTKAGSATTLTSTARPVDPTDPTKGNQTVLDVGGSVISNVGEGKLEAGSKDLVNGDQVYKGLLAARTEVQAGTNIASVTKELGANGQDIYTVNAEGTTVSVGNDSKYLSVVKGEKDANNVTDYKLDLSDEAKQVIDTAMTEIVTQIDGQDVKTVKKGDNRMNFVSGDNIELTSENGAVKVSTKRDASFDSVRVGDVNIDNNGVSVGDVNISQEGINAGGKRVSNIGDGKEAGDAVNVRQLQGTANALNQKMEREDRKLRAGIAGAAAMATLVQAYNPNDSLLAVGGGTYRGGSAVAVGYSRVSDNGKIILKVAGSVNNAGHYMGGASVGFKF